MSACTRPAVRIRHVAAMAAVTLVVILVAAGGSVAANPFFSFADNPGRLPKTVVPIHYAIEFAPDLDAMTIAGSEIVDIEVLEPVSRVVLNALNLEIAAAVTLGDGGQSAAIALDGEAQMATLTFPAPLAAGRHRLRIYFTARINSFGRGLFSIDYPEGEGRKRMIASQLEPAEARRIFPSWDEPAFKASFALTVTVPASWMAVSNMPVAHEEAVDPARKRVSFASTPKMSSYLFALIAGELERRTVTAGEVAIGVVTTAGKAEQGRYALDEAVRLLAYFDDYFGIPYTLPKLDLIALPGGIGGAMENWGAITFFEGRLLFDPATSPPGARRSIFAILAHEMAHQWFGDLVTMGWWDNLWLNEGFATWMQNKAAEVLHPDWQVWLHGADSKQWAMSEDARRTTHPIQQPVANESEALAAFDGITYSKGQAFIRMLESHLGADVFRDGIRRYMKAHAHGNATTADLWRALEEAAGRPVAEIARRYTEQPGVPLVLAEARCAGERQQIVLRQERFTLRDPEAAALRWQVPIVMGSPAAAQNASTVLLDGTAEIAAAPCGAPVKLNLGDVGYYRVQYDAATLEALTAAFGTMAPIDRVNLLADSWALVEAGRMPPAPLFALIEAVPEDDSRAVWEQVVRILVRLDQLQRGQPGRAAFQAHARAVLRPPFARLGWERASRESADDSFLRPRLIGVLGDFGDAEILAEAKRRFAAFLRDPAALAPGLRNPVTHLVGRTADRATYDTLLALSRRTASGEERGRYAYALASALDPALAAETLRIALGDDLPTNLAWSVPGWVASAGEQPELAWDFVRANLPALVARLGPNYRDNAAINLTWSVSDRRWAGEVAAFAPGQETPAGRIAAAKAQDRILANADFRGEVLPAVDEWIRERGGAR